MMFALNTLGGKHSNFSLIIHVNIAKDKAYQRSWHSCVIIMSFLSLTSSRDNKDKEAWMDVHTRGKWGPHV